MEQTPLLQCYNCNQLNTYGATSCAYCGVPFATDYLQTAYGQETFSFYQQPEPQPGVDPEPVSVFEPVPDPAPFEEPAPTQQQPPVIYPPVVPPPAPATSPSPASQSSGSTSNTVLNILLGLVILLLVVCVGVGAYLFGPRIYDQLFRDSSQSSSQSAQTGSNANGDSQDQNQQGDSTNQSQQNDNNDEDKDDSNAGNNNKPPSDGIFVGDGVIKSSKVVSDGFANNIADKVRATTFRSDQEFDIKALGLNDTKEFKLSCVAPHTTKGWVLCTGVDTHGDVRVWVKP